MVNRNLLKSVSPLTVVVKLGSSSILNPQSPHFPQLATLSALAETCVALRSLGHRVVIVSSGAIGMGMHRMNSPKSPEGKKRAIGEKQALAAIGQGRLIALWDQLFGTLGQPIAQILLTRNDIADRSRYLNATTTLSTLLSMGVIPIINENDTISVSEILHVNKFGDNDTLSAIAAGMCSADYLFLMTDVEGLYEDNPRKVLGARLVSRVDDIEEVRRLVSTSTLGSSLGTGGMETKLIAAELATAAGCATVITLGSEPSRIMAIVEAHTSFPSVSIPVPASRTVPPITNASSCNAGVLFADETIDNLPLHTLFTPKPRPLTSRRFWILHGLTPRGSIYIDEGAYHAISRGERNGGGGGNGGRLLAAGVICVEGTFAAGQAVRVIVIRGTTGKKRSPKSIPNGERLEATNRDIAVEEPLDLPESRPVSPDHFEDRAYQHSRQHLTESRIDGSLLNSTQSLENLHLQASNKPTESTAGNGGTGAGYRLSCGEELLEFGRGLTNYNSAEIDRIKGLRSSDIQRVLGYSEAEHVVESVIELRAGSR